MIEATRVETSISRVEVFRTRALITRRGYLSAPAGTGAVRLGGLPLALDDASVRVTPPRGLRVLDVHVELELGERQGALCSAAEEELKQLERRRAHLLMRRFHERDRLRWLKSQAPQSPPEQELPERLAFEPRPVVEPRLQLAAWICPEQLQVRENLRAMAREMRELDDAIAAARKRLLEESQAERERLRMIRKAVRLELGGKAERAEAQLELSYLVRGAAWAPVYRVRVSPERGTAELSVGAMVVQASGEDWPRCQMALSTADLERSCELPELQSWRIGRRQPPRPSGWKELPEDLDELFEGYDGGLRQLPAPSRPEPAQLPRMPEPPGLEKAEPATGAAVASVELGDEAPAPLMAQLKSDAGRARPRQAPADREYALARGGAAPAGAPQAMAPPAPSRPAPEHKKREVSRRKEIAKSSLAPEGELVLAEAEEACDRMQAPAECAASYDLADDDLSETTPVESALGAARRALMFQRLRLQGPQDPDGRGRLKSSGLAERLAEQLGAGGGELARLDEQQLLERLALEQTGGAEPELSGQLVSVEESTGNFTVRYQVESPAEVPADGSPHQLSLMRKELPAERHFSCVPSLEATVYQEARFPNPFGTALLAGPVKVYLEGDFVAESSLETTPPGKPIRVNLGVEPAISVARNVHFTESTAGLMGGTSLLEHRVENTVHSKLPRPARIFVFERIPVSDTQDLEVKLVRTQPPAEPYDQSDRGELLRGGLRFSLELGPREKKTCLLEYQISLPAKQVLVGGNRRE